MQHAVRHYHESIGLPDAKPSAMSESPSTPLIASQVAMPESPSTPLVAATGVHVAGPSRPSELDPFFKKSDDVLKTYEFDYDKLAKFDTEVYFASSIIGPLFFPPAWPILGCCLAPTYGCQKQNISDVARAQHLAISQDGIRFVVDRHKTACRLDCQDKGKVSKTVPFDKMTDCDIEEPAGSAGPCCYLVPRVLHTVHVDTASSGAANPNKPGEVMHELTIRGLVDPEGFKRDVWAMKRGEPVDGVDGTVAPMAVSMVRGSSSRREPALAEAVSTAPLLAEQNALLREMLQAMKTAAPPTAAPPAAPEPASEELRGVAAALEETNRLLRQMLAEK